MSSHVPHPHPHTHPHTSHTHTHTHKHTHTHHTHTHTHTHTNTHTHIHTLGSRYTTWSNVHTNGLPNSAPPPVNPLQPATHSSSAMHRTPNTEGTSAARIEENHTDSCSIESSDTASTTDSINSLSYTTITTSSLNLVSVDKKDSSQQLQAPKTINSPPTSNNEAERHRLSNCSDNTF